MEFNEKLRELRTSKSLTQEELAEALFVSRTAISKWESGRGYPSLASLMEISKFFSISIDELIATEEAISLAEDEKKEYANQYVTLICHGLDIFLGLLLFLPIFGNGGNDPSSLALYAATNIRLWIKVVVFVLIGLTVLNGVSGMIISRLNKPIWNHHRLATGMALYFIDTVAFILIRQPYPSIICLLVLLIKGLLLGIRIYNASAKGKERLRNK